jgi:hypothetical protein
MLLLSLCFLTTLVTTSSVTELVAIRIRLPALGIGRSKGRRPHLSIVLAVGEVGIVFPVILVLEVVLKVETKGALPALCTLLQLSKS